VAKVTPPTSVASVSSADLDRKRATLKAIEDAVEKLKEEAARNPQNAALAKAYLQLCEAALAMKAEVIAAEGK
jgi:predicted translin family RNA/ssDNA-binding protein